MNYSVLGSNVTDGIEILDRATELESWKNAETIIHGHVLPVVTALGILGIILTVIVLSQKNMCTSTNCYLMALAIADLLYLILSFINTVAVAQVAKREHAMYIFQVYQHYSTIFLHIFLMASTWLTVLLAIERYIAICQPFLAAKMCSVKKSRIFTVSIFILSFLCRTPTFWEHKLMTHKDPISNKTIVFLQAQPFAHNEAYVKSYPLIIEVVLNSIIPFILLFVLNIRLIWEVKKSTRYLQQSVMIPRNSTNHAQREELQITIMLISVIIVFFICQAPYVLYNSINSVNMRMMTSPAFMLFRYIAILLLTLKSAVNFILYCWFSEKFWQTLKRILFIRACSRIRKGNGTNSQNGSYYHMRRISNCTMRETI